MTLTKSAAMSPTLNQTKILLEQLSHSQPDLQLKLFE
ncbi:hypothetical protein BGS_0598 [Beggiatoa sp. SS]|nr:hypothetical protein BGS_0598 [Beggiatoa sp. SS]